MYLVKKALKNGIINKGYHSNVPHNTRKRGIMDEILKNKQRTTRLR